MGGFWVSREIIEILDRHRRLAADAASSMDTRCVGLTLLVVGHIMAKASKMGLTASASTGHLSHEDLFPIVPGLSNTL